MEVSAPAEFQPRLKILVRFQKPTQGVEKSAKSPFNRNGNSTRAEKKT